MTIQSATPYLMLPGKADQAIEFYRGALRVDVEALVRFGDMDKSCPAAQQQRVMHAVLRVGNARLMLSDSAGDGGTPRGGAVSVALELDDAVETRRLFDALAASGTVIQPVFDAPWGGLFGAVVDQFGVSWLFNCTQKPS